jgi:hypothetical protein
MIDIRWDTHSLKQNLDNPVQRTAVESFLPNWSGYQLDAEATARL